MREPRELAHTQNSKNPTHRAKKVAHFLLKNRTNAPKKPRFARICSVFGEHSPPIRSEHSEAPLSNQVFNIQASKQKISHLNT